jgi:hypothetical protein
MVETFIGRFQETRDSPPYTSPIRPLFREGSQILMKFQAQKQLQSLSRKTSSMPPRMKSWAVGFAYRVI